MAISSPRLQDFLRSSGRILMRMVLVFYPSLAVPYICRVILLFNSVTEKMNLQMTCLQGWIVVVISNLKNACMLYRQSAMRLLDQIVEKMSSVWKTLMPYLLSMVKAVRNPIADKMKNLSEALKMYLAIDAAEGQYKAKLIGKLALLYAALFFQDSELRLKYDKTGVITACFIFICLRLLIFSHYWSKKLEILCRRWGCTTNSTSNFTCFILGIFFENFYNNSIRNIGAAFCMTIFTLSLLVVLHPPTDLGFFGFIIGVVGSVTYSQFGLKYPTWIIFCLCFVMFSFKSWLDKHWLNLEEEDLPQLPNDAISMGSSIMIAGLPYTWKFVNHLLIWSAVGDVSSLSRLVSSIIMGISFAGYGWVYCHYYLSFGLVR